MRKGRLLGALFKSQPRSLSTDCLAPRSRGSWPGEDLAGDYSPSIAGQKIPMQGFYPRSSERSRRLGCMRTTMANRIPRPSTSLPATHTTWKLPCACRQRCTCLKWRCETTCTTPFRRSTEPALLADALRPFRRGIVGRRIRGMPHQGTALLRARENLNCRTDAPHQRFCGKLAFEDIGQHERTGVGAAGGPSHEPRQL